MGTPLELIKYNTTNGKFEIGKAAIDALRKVRGAVGVVAVCGRARQGKSFILNQLLMQSSGGGFQVGPTHRPCTKGLWMWSTPQRIQGQDGADYHLVLLDTEGIDAYDQTAQYSTQIFSLAVLLSSMFVYNQMGGIDESALDRLSLVTEMTRHIHVKASGGNTAKGEDAELLAQHSPAFLWLLRDFYLQLEEEGGRKITARDYLETALRPVSGAGPSVEAKNAIRASISSLFPHRDCFTLVRPMHDESKLVSMDTLPREQLRPEFRQGVHELTQMIFRRAQPKRYGTQVVTGPVLAGLVEAYVGAINQGAVPTIATAWQGVAEQECRRGCDAAEAAYVATWRGPGGGEEAQAEEAELEERHQRCLAKARAAYEEIAVGEESIRRAHEARWLSAVTARYKDAKGRRLAEAAAAVNEMLYKAATNIAQAARGGADLAQLQQQLTAFANGFASRAAGPTKWQKLAAFLQDTWPAAAGQVLERQAAAAKALLEAAQRDMQQLQSQLAASQQRAEQAERAQREGAGTASMLQQQLSAAQQELAGLRAAVDQKSAKVAALEAQLAEVLAVSERKAAGAVELADARIAATQAEAQARVAELAAQLTAERARVSSLTADLDSMGARCSGSEGRLASLEAECLDWRARHSREASEKVAIMGERDQARDSAALLAVERDSIARERDAARAQLAQMMADLEGEARAKAAMQTKLDELMAEAQAVRDNAQLMTAGRGTPGNDENRHPDGSGGGVLADSNSIGTMTVQEIKDVLTQGGFAEDVWKLTNRKPAPKKADWVELLRLKNA